MVKCGQCFRPSLICCHKCKEGICKLCIDLECSNCFLTFCIDCITACDECKTAVCKNCMLNEDVCNNCVTRPTKKNKN